MLTVDRLRAVLDYDPATGIFTWKICRQRPDLVGARAGTRNQGGYWHIIVAGPEYKAHILAWLYVHGAWPTKHLDHENGDTIDNRVANLREATRSQNLANSRRRIDNASGFKGVSLNRSTGRWVANINKDGCRHYLGLFDSPEDAHAAYQKAARELHGEFARPA